MTAQPPAAPETETDANGLTEAECGDLRDAATISWGHLYAVAQRIVAERVRVVEGERDAAWAQADDWAAQFEGAACEVDEAIARAESAEAQLRVIEGERDAAERSKAALVAKVKRLQDQIARASMEPGQDRQKAMHAYAARAESAEAAHEAEKAAHERLRAGVEALARDLAARAEGKHDLASETDYEVDIARFNGEGTGLGIAHALATDLLGTPASESPYMNELEHCSSSDDRALLDGSRGPVTGVDLIRAERQRQIDIEGYSAEHDEHHGGFALSQAAYCYKAYGLLPRGAVPDLWPWDRESWKPRDPARNLIRSGALYLAAAEQGYPGSREAADRCALLLDEAAASLLRGGEAR